MPHIGDVFWHQAQPCYSPSRQELRDNNKWFVMLKKGSVLTGSQFRVVVLSLGLCLEENVIRQLVLLGGTLF